MRFFFANSIARTIITQKPPEVEHFWSEGCFFSILGWGMGLAGGSLAERHRGGHMNLVLNPLALDLMKVHMNPGSRFL